MKDKKYVERKEAVKAGMELVAKQDIRISDKFMINGLLIGLYKEIVGGKEAEKLLDEILAEMEADE